MFYYWAHSRTGLGTVLVQKIQRTDRTGFLKHTGIPVRNPRIIREATSEEVENYG